MQHFEEQAALFRTANSQGNFMSFQEAPKSHPCQAQQSSDDSGEPSIRALQSSIWW